MQSSRSAPSAFVYKYTIADLRKRLRRGQVLGHFSGLSRCLIGMEARATAHHWARELIALGHEVRLMPPQYVKAYVKRNKNDAADAEAICEAVTRIPLATSSRPMPLPDLWRRTTRCVR